MRQEVYVMAHKDDEAREAAELPTDWMSAQKADNHNHHSAAMTQSHLLQFIQSVLSQKHHQKAIHVFLEKKRVSEADTQKVRKLMKLAESSSLTLTMLDVFAHDQAFDRFDVFNAKYSPFRLPVLRDVFLKPGVFMEVTFPSNKTRNVSYMADMTIDLCQSLHKNYFPEWRISIYGRGPGEWEQLLQFFEYTDARSTGALATEWYGLHMGDAPRVVRGQTVGAACQKQVNWLVQVPRVFDVWLKIGMVKSFEQHLDFVFKPLMEHTPRIAKVLTYIRAIDSVDDETKDNGDVLDERPADVSHGDLPFSYYMYHMAINIATVNRLHGTNIKFRPHCGEGGSDRHLVVCFLLADGISHGLNLRNSAVMSYMYYITRMPVSMSLSSNNYLVAKYDQSPFGLLYKYGLRISLSTDDPLIFFQEEDEQACIQGEYMQAEALFGLSWVDLAEVGRNSLIMSSYTDEYMAKVRGIKNPEDSSNEWVNDERNTGLPKRRIDWRKSEWCCALDYIGDSTSDPYNVCNGTCKEPALSVSSRT
jgi:AMP deaminase